jgi:cobalamin biosynthesis protein CobD/CbiB
MENLTLKENLIIFLLNLACFTSITALGVFFNAPFVVFALFVCFGFTNKLLERSKKKRHAPALGKIKGFYLCWLSSFFVMFLGIKIVNTTSKIIPYWQSIIIGIIVVVFSAISMGDVFYCSSQTSRKMNPNHKEIRQRIGKMLKPDVTKLLKENLSDNEYTAIYYVDYEDMTIEFVADTILCCSPRKVSTYRHNGFEKLARLYSK